MKNTGNDLLTVKEIWEDWCENINLPASMRQIAAENTIRCIADLMDFRGFYREAEVVCSILSSFKDVSSFMGGPVMLFNYACDRSMMISEFGISIDDYLILPMES
jgi:hypothetical protein